MLQSGLGRYALVIGVDTLSKITDFTDRTTCVLFGDGAGAVVLGPTVDDRGFLSFELGADGGGGHLLRQPAGGSRLPASYASVEAREHCITMSGQEVFRFAVRILGISTQAALAKAGLAPADIDLLIPHQANLRIIETAIDRLALPADKIYVNLDRYGNTSSASIPIALDEVARVALHRVLCGPLMREVTAVIGEIEEAGAKRNLEFFHVPTVVIRGVVPPGPENPILYKALQCRRFYPFAFLVADLALQQARLAAVERALDLPGEQAIRGLIALKRTIQVARSGLEPSEGLVSHSNGSMIGACMTQPKGYVDAPYLQTTATLLEQIKRRSYALMQLQQGQRVLDVGCGAGVDTIALARLVGPTGQVVGVDTDAGLLAEACQRAEDAGVSARVRHEQGNALSLPFADDVFDACRSERLFQHLVQPARVLTEMTRVTKGGGWIVVVDTDWGSMSIDHPEVDIERRLARVLAEQTLHNGYAGRQLYRLCRQQQLMDVLTEMIPVSITRSGMARQIGRLDAVERQALQSGSITQAELQRWHAGLERADADGTFFASANIVLVAGRKR